MSTRRISSTSAWLSLLLVACGDDAGSTSATEGTGSSESGGTSVSSVDSSATDPGSSEASSSDSATTLDTTTTPADTSGTTSTADDTSSSSGGTTTEDPTTGESSTANDSSSSTGVAPFCGDGNIDANEECDDGPANADDGACTSLCVVATCGDALVYAGVEECDDAGESATCNADCSAAECGDSILNLTAGEECDDGGVAPGDFCDGACAIETITFEFTGDVQSIDLPAWATAARIEAFGAQGGGSRCCDSSVQDDGGPGGYAVGTFDVLGGDTLYVFVGGQGATEGAGGFNGGGAGGQWGAGGGGASDVRLGGQELGDRIVVAGGGGGGNCGCPEHGAGGAGGGLVGDNGSDGGGGFTPGGGATQTDGGLAGSNPGAPGALGVGGSNVASPYHVGGGGGGYYGGGSAYAAGGGGGSSWMGDGIDVDTTVGVQVDDGRVTVRPLP